MSVNRVLEHGITTLTQDYSVLFVDSVMESMHQLIFQN